MTIYRSLMTLATISLVLMLVGPQARNSSLCRWGEAREVGLLDEPIIEASGLAVSRRFGDRLYHVNDSGDTGRFFITDALGRALRSVAISGFQPIDVEDIALGACNASTTCIFIGDIGDNERKRRDLELVVIEERAEFSAEIRARHRVRMRYPDAPHDAESLGVHPDGSVYVMTKELERNGAALKAGMPRIYRLKRKQWQDSTKAVETLELVLTLDMGKLLPNSDVGSRLPTAMDISADGQRVFILTYRTGLELMVNLSARQVPPPETWAEGRHYRRVPLVSLEQQEAAAYTPNGNALLYTTERLASRARIMKVECTK